MSLLLSCGRLFSDDRIRLAQEELRKRHLFFGEITGEPSPALTAAIGHYQKKKGFSRTGRLDVDTAASLGLIKVATAPPSTPFVVAETGDLRGANGEALPSFLVLRPSGDERSNHLDLASTDRHQIALSLAHTDTALTLPQPASKGRSHGRSHRIKPRTETNPLVLAFHSVNRAMKLLVGDTSPKRKRMVAKRL